jgi:hypothetical protein
MVKKIIWIVLSLILLGGLIFGAVNRTLAKTGEGETRLANNQAGNSGIKAGEIASDDCEEEAGLKEAALPAADPQGVSAAEAAALSFMREEEKLAHDVYLKLYELWGKRNFLNIANSEQTHTEAVLALLERYGLDDPAYAEAGRFSNPDLQALYDQMIERGSQSLEEALRVGILIEETDINDLQARLAQVDNADIQQVFNNLLLGSRNHLQAFTRVLQNETGQGYRAGENAQAAGSQGAGAAQAEGSQGQGGGYRGGRP